jgi:hypothetical protein
MSQLQELSQQCFGRHADVHQIAAIAFHQKRLYQAEGCRRGQLLHRRLSNCTFIT